MGYLMVAIGMKEKWTPLSNTKLGWSMKIKSKQEEDCGRICVESVISWWSPWDEEADSRSIHSFVETLSSHQEFDLQLKSYNISLKLDYSNSCQLLLDQSFAKSFWSHLRIVMGNWIMYNLVSPTSQMMSYVLKFSKFRKI